MKLTQNRTHMNTIFFKPIKLNEMDKVQLMSRVDKKYVFHIKQLQNLLFKLANDYYILHIDSETEMQYSTTYYDTAKDRMYIAHHNGKLNRYKIRRRSYILSGISFLEIKFKNNKGRTVKTRILTDYNKAEFDSKERVFLETNSPFHANELDISLQNKFSRITLVNKNFRERCTIDYNIEFTHNDKRRVINNLVIAEIKSDGNTRLSPLARQLHDLRIKSAGFSKYCIGRTLLDQDLKQNNFKQKIRKLKKLTTDAQLSA